MRRALIAGIVALVLAAFVAGCGATRWPDSYTAGSSTPPERSVGPNGYDRVKVPDADLSLDVPHAWSSFDLTKQRVQDIVDFLKRDNPELAKQLAGSGQSVIAKTVRFFAIDAHPTSGPASNVSVSLIAGNRLVPGTFESLRMGIERTGATIRDSRQVELSGRLGYRLAYELPFKRAAGEPFKAHGVLLYANVRDGVAIVAVTTGNDADGDETADRIIDSITVI